MGKLYAIGFVVALIVAIVIGGRKLSDDGNPPAAPDPAPLVLDPADHALGLCEAWTQKNSKLEMGEITEEHKISGPYHFPRAYFHAQQIPADHGLVEIDYRAKGLGLLMISQCEYSLVAGTAVLVEAESRPK